MQADIVVMFNLQASEAISSFSMQFRSYKMWPIDTADHIVSYRAIMVFLVNESLLI